MLEGGGTIGASDTEAGMGDVAWLTHSAEPSPVTFTSGDEAMRAILFAGKNPCASPLPRAVPSS